MGLALTVQLHLLSGEGYYQIHTRITFMLFHWRWSNEEWFHQAMNIIVNLLFF